MFKLSKKSGKKKQDSKKESKKTGVKKPDLLILNADTVPTVNELPLVEDATPEKATETNILAETAVNTPANTDGIEALPREYQADLPASLSADLAELAKMTTELESQSKGKKTGLLGIFQTKEAAAELEALEAENIQEAVTGEGEPKQPIKDADQSTENTAIQEVVAAGDSKEVMAENSETIAKNAVANTASAEPTTKDSIFSFAQLSTLLKQQKSLLQKIAAFGNTPIFDPEKFSQLIKAVPAILAWQKAGAPVPTVPASNQNSSTTTSTTSTNPTEVTVPDGQNATTAPAEFNELTQTDLQKETNTAYEVTMSAAKEKTADIAKNMGIALEGTTKPEEGKAVDTKKIAKEVEAEDFLESTIQQEVDSPALAYDGIDAEVIPQKSAAELAKIQKKEKAEEAAWAEEAKIREKMLEEKRKAAQEQLSKNSKKGSDKISLKMPEQKKQGFMATLLHKISYFGLGKLKDEFIDNLGIMMDAGLPLLDALRTLEMEAKQKPYKKILSQVVVAVETGSPLWRAMESTYFFDGLQISMIKVGEQAGNLTENLRYLAKQSAKQRELKGKVKTAMIYPIIVFVMLTLIIFGLGMFVLPNLIQVIMSLGVPLPFITRMIVAFTNIFEQHGTILVPSVFGGAMLVLILHKYTSFKVVTQFLIMKIPGIGTLIRESILSQFGVTIGGLLQAGVPITDAIESVANVTSITKYKKFYYLLLQHIRLGDSFATSFAAIKMTNKCFPTSMQQLIKTGEKSGSLTHIMMKISEIHEQKATDVAEKLPVILEPMLLLFIGTLVGGIALGVLAPIYGIVGNIG